MLNTLLAAGLIVSAPNQEKNVPSVMYQFLYEVTELQPYFSSQKAYSSPSNRKKIQGHLENLQNLSKRFSHHERLDDAVFQMTASQLELQLQSALQSFREGRSNYSRRLVHEVLDGCASCHSQVQAKSSNQWKFDESKIKGSTFEKAEFWYSVRQYETALELYDQIVREFKSGKSDHFVLDSSIRHLASILVRVYSDLDRAQMYFTKYASLSNLPKPTRERLRIWSNSAEALAKSKLQNKNPDEILKMARGLFDNRDPQAEVVDADLVQILYLSGLLYSFVHKKEKLSPEILLYLAKCERVLGQDFLRTLGHQYLRSCIVRFPSSSTARACFSELKEQIELEFTGSDGLNMPPEVKESLENLRQRLSSKDKKQK